MLHMPNISPLTWAILSSEACNAPTFEIGYQIWASTIVFTRIRGTVVDILKTKVKLSAWKRKMHIFYMGYQQLCSMMDFHAFSKTLAANVKYWCFTCKTFLHLLWEQFFPVKPATHAHWKSATRSVQVPLFSHGLEAQSSISKNGDMKSMALKRDMHKYYMWFSNTFIPSGNSMHFQNIAFTIIAK